MEKTHEEKGEEEIKQMRERRIGVCVCVCVCVVTWLF